MYRFFYDLQKYIFSHDYATSVLLSFVRLVHLPSVWLFYVLLSEFTNKKSGEH